MKINQVLSIEEIRLLVRPSDLRGFQAVFCTWGIIAGSFALAALYPSWWSVAIALILLGGRHLALAILMHDASHYSLFRTRWLNNFMGTWFGAYPTWQDLKRYRGHHWNHHMHAGSDKDPDLDLVSPFPVTRASLARKLLRDLSGLSGLKRVYGQLLMDLEKIEYTVSSKMVPISQEGRTGLDTCRRFLRNIRGVVVTNAILFSILFFAGYPWVYLLWVISYLTTFSVFVRIRSIAEHACTQMDLDPVKCTRTTLATPLARVTVAPHRVNYHLEHHLLMTVPYYNLPRMHRMLRAKGALGSAYIARNYWEVMKTASSRS